MRTCSYRNSGFLFVGWFHSFSLCVHLLMCRSCSLYPLLVHGIVGLIVTPAVTQTDVTFQQLPLSQLMRFPVVWKYRLSCPIPKSLRKLGWPQLFFLVRDLTSGGQAAGQLLKGLPSPSVQSYVARESGSHGSAIHQLGQVTYLTETQISHLKNVSSS